MCPESDHLPGFDGPAGPAAPPVVPSSVPPEPTAALPDPAAVSAQPTDGEHAMRRRADELAVVARKQAEFADELLTENRRLREGEVREAVAPFVRGLARLSDELAQIRATGNRPTKADLMHVTQRVHELLHDAGVGPVSPAPGDPFDVTLHEAAGSVPTEDPTLDRTVVAVRRPGLRRDDGRLLRPALVIVHRFETRTPKGPPA